MEHDSVSQKCLKDSIQACALSGYDPQLFIPISWGMPHEKWENEKSVSVLQFFSYFD